MSLIKIAILGYDKLKTIDALKKGIHTFENGIQAQETGRILAKQKTPILSLSEKRKALLGN